MAANGNKVRVLHVNWKAVQGAAHGKKRLSIQSNEAGLFPCPVKLCLHTDFGSKRGLRKHINSRHPWYFYFDEQPQVKKEELEELEPIRKKSYTGSKPAFSLDEGIGFEFVKWLNTTCGGGKSNKEARQIANRSMKFLMHAMGNNESGNDLDYEFVDCCLCSPTIIVSFLSALEKEWKLSSSGALNYVTSIEDMLDFRKAHKVTDNTLRCFTVTEVYLRRAKVNLRRKKNVECNRNLDLETLIARDSWASIEEMEQVIPFHMKTFKNILMKCNSIDNGVLTRSDLTFTVRFISTLLFLRVKCTRPMSFKFLTVTMIEKAKKNDGFIDQTEFKTSTTYVFDSLIISEDVFEIVDLYIEHLRPRLSPKCDYLLISLNGTQYQSLTTAMILLVKQAIGKYINPTRYRQIIETESTERLTQEEQHFVSEDQKHSSKVAKLHYKKTYSRRMAVEGKKCMDKMTNQCRPRENLVTLLNSFDNNVLEKSRQIIEGAGFSGWHGHKSSATNVSVNSESEDSDDPYKARLDESLRQEMDKLNVTSTSIDLTVAVKSKSVENNIPIIPVDDKVVKKEVATSLVTKRGSNKNVKFTEDEDKFLWQGIKKYGRKAWALILKDDNFKFHKSRTRDSLRVRADSAKFKKVSLLKSNKYVMFIFLCKLR